MHTTSLKCPEGHEHGSACPAPRAHHSRGRSSLRNGDWQEHGPRPARLHGPERQELERVRCWPGQPRLAFLGVERF